MVGIYDLRIGRPRKCVCLAPEPRSYDVCSIRKSTAAISIYIVYILHMLSSLYIIIIQDRRADGS